MKTTLEIARECSVTQNKIRHIVDNEKLIIKKTGGRLRYTKLQEEQIHQILQPEFIILESKMNKL
jgi:predicted transcriptional regulator